MASQYSHRCRLGVSSSGWGQLQVCHKHGCLWRAVGVGQITHTCLHLKSQKHKILAFMHRNDGDKSMTNIVCVWKTFNHVGFCSLTKASSSERQDVCVFSFSFSPLISNMKTGPCRNHTKNAKRNTIKKKEKPCVRLVPEKWWWKQILASRWWKGMSTPSSLTELPFRSPDSSSFAKASLTKKKKTMTGGQIPVTAIRNKTEQKEATGSGDSKPQD